MDRVYLAIIVSALLLFLGAAALYVTRTADLMPLARTVGVSGSRSIRAKRSAWQRWVFTGPAAVVATGAPFHHRF